MNLNIANSENNEVITALVRPTVEYASSIWDPQTQKDKAKTRNDTEKVSICYLTKRYHHTLAVKPCCNN